ncbi:MAG TPA: glucosaminidase domain-containing protein, partial [Gaiellaceae bacterium]|nr:glucosaminidase domain-containing protein [Gaiellaceae bacterium]
MRPPTRITFRLGALVALASIVAALAVVVPTVADRESNIASAATTPTLSVMGPSQLTAAELVNYYRTVDHHTFPYRVVNLNPFTGTVTAVPLEDLANLFITEGARYNVRGDVAFAQSIVETAWFNFPDWGQVRPWNNNFAGIGACDSCSNGFQFPSLQDGVRAQIQLLRNYADINSRTTNIPDPPVPSLWGSTPQVAAANF